jgi:hypothetical protein
MLSVLHIEELEINSEEIVLIETNTARQKDLQVIVPLRLRVSVFYGFFELMLKEEAKKVAVLLFVNKKGDS